jgi:hypothetical protein
MDNLAVLMEAQKELCRENVGLMNGAAVRCAIAAGATAFFSAPAENSFKQYNAAFCEFLLFSRRQLIGAEHQSRR